MENMLDRANRHLDLIWEGKLPGDYLRIALTDEPGAMVAMKPWVGFFLYVSPPGDIKPFTMVTITCGSFGENFLRDESAMLNKLELPNGTPTEQVGKRTIPLDELFVLMDDATIKARRAFRDEGLPIGALTIGPYMGKEGSAAILHQPLALEVGPLFQTMKNYAIAYCSDLP